MRSLFALTQLARLAWSSRRLRDAVGFRNNFGTRLIRIAIDTCSSCFSALIVLQRGTMDAFDASEMKEEQERLLRIAQLACSACRKGKGKAKGGGGGKPSARVHRPPMPAHAVSAWHSAQGESA